MKILRNLPSGRHAEFYLTRDGAELAESLVEAETVGSTAAIRVWTRDPRKTFNPLPVSVFERMPLLVKEIGNRRRKDQGMEMRKWKRTRVRIFPGIREMVVLVFLVASVGSGEDKKAESKFVWDTVNLDGRSHVSMEQIQEFYDFPTLEKVNSGLVSLRRGRTILDFDASDQWFIVNKVKLKPCFPIRKDEGGDFLISTVDLAKTIEPTIRPKYIQFERNEGLKIFAVVTKEEGFDAPLDSTDPPGDTNARIFLHLQRGALSVRSEILPPFGVSTAAKNDPAREVLPGNKFDTLNVAIAVACHANILHKLEAEDLGINRSLHPDVSTADMPAVRITLTLPDRFDQWDVLSETIDEAIETVQAATSKNKKAEE